MKNGSLDKHSSIPLYAQLRELIVERIEDGVYPSGERIPSEMQLCEELALSRPTVRQAIADLVSDGILEIAKGRGTFVAVTPDRVTMPHFNALTLSFLNLSDLGKIDLAPVKLIEKDLELDNAFKHVDRSVRAGYWHCQWPVPLDTAVLGYCHAYIPVALFPELGQALAAGKRMVDLKANKYAFLPQKGSLMLTARPATDREARQLEIPRRSLVVAIDGPLFAKNGHACEYLRAAFRPDLLKFEIN